MWKQPISMVFRVASMRLLFSLLRGPTQTAGSVMLMMVAASTSHLHGQSALWSSLATRTL